MKFIQFAGHPLVVLCLYPFLIIEGNHFGGFYLLYLLLALPHGAGYALLAAAGILLLLLGYNLTLPGREWLRQWIYIAGVMLMVLSLLEFFKRADVTGDMATFAGGVPLWSFIIFGFCLLCFLLRSVWIFTMTVREAHR